LSRSLWSGWLSFGLINLPVKLYTAIKKKTVNFHQLRAADGCRVRLRKICSSDRLAVAAENLVKGFEISPGEYVMLDDKELAQLAPSPSRHIEIEEFVSLSEIDPIYFRQHYYLIPGAEAIKTYALLTSALGQTGQAALARLVMRGKEYLTLLRPADNVINLSVMYYADELWAIDELPEPARSPAEPTPRELAMARQLIESLSADFSPEKYHNEYHTRLMELIEHKAAGQTPATGPVPKEGARIIDLTAALEASLAAVNKKPPPRGRRKIASGH
jgi:DNA end-binding protein Ku